MADKKFGVRQIDLVSTSGTTNIETPNTLNLKSNQVAISTDLSIGGNIVSHVKVGTGFSVGIGTTIPKSALEVSGTARATYFIGDGSGLTGVTGVGAGIAISESGVTVGTAQTINFIGAGITFSPVRSGITTCTVDVPLFTTLNSNLDLSTYSIVGSGVTINSSGLNISGVSTLGRSVIGGVNISSGIVTAAGLAVTQRTATFSQGAVITGVTTFNNDINLKGSGLVLNTGSDDNIFSISYDSNNDDISFNWQQSGGTGGSQIIWYVPESSSFVLRNPAVAEYLAEFTTGQGAILYYDGVERFRTTSTGINITGITTTATIVATAASVTGGGIVAGLGTINNINTTNIDVTGIATITEVIVGSAVTAGEYGIDVAGGLNVTGIGSITEVIVGSAVTINSGGLNVTGIGTIESLNTINGSFSNITITGLSTFTNGTVLVGTATSTGTENQKLQVSGGAYVSGSVGIGTTVADQLLHVGMGGSDSFVVTNNGYVGIGTTLPTARLHIVDYDISSGTAPIKIEASDLLSTPEEGSIEYDGFTFYSTPGPVYGRGFIPSIVYTEGASDDTPTNAGVGYNMFPSGRNTIFLYEGMYLCTVRFKTICPHTNSTSFGLLINFKGNGTADGTAAWSGETSSVTDATDVRPQMYQAQPLGVGITVTAPTTSTAKRLQTKGECILKITSSGSINPQFIFSGTQATSGIITGLNAEFDDTNYMYISRMSAVSNASPVGAGWS